MGTLLMVVFDNEAGARAGAKALRALHAEGAVTVYAFAIVAREPRGRGLAVREPMAEGSGAAAPALGAAVGALVTLLGGPAATVTRTVDQGLVEAVRDLVDAGLDADFLKQVSRHLRAGGSAVVAEAEEASPLPLETRVVALGGRIIRCGHGRTTPVELVIREVEALRNELIGLREELGRTEHAATAQAVRRTRAIELRRSLERARLMAGALRSEVEAKVAVLRAQAARLEGEARAAVERRAGAVRATLEARVSSLDRLVEDLAWLAPGVRGSGRNRRGPSK
jgi:uncharacterized membrane protein